MMTLNINSEDLARLVRKLDKKERDVAIKRGMNRAGLNLVHWIMKERLQAPPGFHPFMLHKRTGRLMGSIGSKTSDGVWNYDNDTYTLKLGTNVEYAPKHEYGIGVRKRPFMSASIEDRQNQDDTLTIITQALQEALDKE